MVPSVPSRIVCVCVCFYSVSENEVERMEEFVQYFVVGNYIKRKGVILFRYC